MTMRLLGLILLTPLFSACVKPIVKTSGVCSPYSPPDTLKTKNGFRVKGGEIIAPDGKRFIPHGVNRPSFEWTPTGDRISFDDFKTMADWGFNTVRLPLNQSFWLAGASDYDPQYKCRLDEAVNHVTGLGMVAILDLHWSDRGDFAREARQQLMPDKNSLIFWREVASRYKDNQLVMFDLYNEPHHVTWRIWRDGGETYQGWRAVGFKELVKTVRDTGAKNIILISGLDWGFDLSGLPRYAIKDENVVYSTHVYPFPDRMNPTGWRRGFGDLAESGFPVIIGEVGHLDGRTNFAIAVLDYARRKNIGWIVWAWYPWDRWPSSSVILDWRGTPSPLGLAVRAHLRKIVANSTAVTNKKE